MTSAFVLIYKTKDLFSSNTRKIIVFKNFDEAYQYGINFDTHINKHIKYLPEETIKNGIVWISNNQIYPKHKCEILEIFNDMDWGVYQNVPDGTQLMNYIIKTLKTNNIL